MAEVATIPDVRARLAQAQTIDSAPERDTQPLWFRTIIAGATVITGNARTYIFNKQKNTDPDLTNLELAGAMPTTSGYKVTGIELRPNANCSAPALAAFLANHRLKIEVGAKNFEKVNQPCVMFPSLSSVASLGNSTAFSGGAYLFNPSEEIKLQPGQTFNVYFEADRDGAIIGGAGDVLDLIVSFRGQKIGTLAL
ncbi:MAG TPA: hypothetical protein VJ549_00515 [Geothrix sp.]|nr:hypothetical protein [Geothrix sp.]HJV47730.1 hypothetical protein [Geothrix sp.]